MNKVILMGNISRDLDIRTLPNTGNLAVRTGIAVNRRYRSSDGTQKEEVMFIDIVAYGRSAEIMRDFLGKGRQILVEGRLNYSQWEHQDGSKRSKHEVIVDNFQMLGGRKDSSATDEKNGGSVDDSSSNQFDENDLPF